MIGSQKPPYLPYVVTAPSFGGASDESLANCIWCGKRWYAIQHKDGVCHSCIKEGKQTLQQLEDAKLRRTVATICFVLAVLAVLVIVACVR